MTEERIVRTELEAYSTDQSIFKVMPAGRFVPKSAKDIGEIIEFIGEHHAGNPCYSLTARAGGTCMSGGPLNDGIIINTTEHLGGILSFDEEHKRVWVGTGTYYRDLEEYLMPHGLMFAPYTSSKNICCIGGMIGNNASGEKSFRYGATRNTVRSLRMVCADGNEYMFGPLSSEELEAKKKLTSLEGEIYRILHQLFVENCKCFNTKFPRVRKNASGYALNAIYDADQDVWNLAKLLVGSQGTLGIITQAELELVPIAPYSALFVLPIDTFANVPDILDEVAKEMPDTVEVYDHKTLELSCAEDPTTAAHLAHLLAYRAVLLVEYSATTEDELDRKKMRFSELCAARRIEAECAEDPEVAAMHWKTRRDSFRLLKEYATHGTPAPIIEDISVRRDQLDALFDDLDAILGKYGFEYVFHGHIADGSIRVFPVVDLNEIGATDRLLNMSEEVFCMVAKRGGTISTDHNDGIIRTPFLPLMYDRDILKVFEKIKQAFDPKNIFNPGKKTTLSRDYLKAVVNSDTHGSRSPFSRFFSKLHGLLATD